jgi:hypothetical protein
MKLFDIQTVTSQEKYQSLRSLYIVASATMIIATTLFIFFAFLEAPDKISMVPLIFEGLNDSLWVNSACTIILAATFLVRRSLKRSIDSSESRR